MASWNRSGAARRGHLGDRTAAYVDGQLDGPEMARARDHVGACADCASAVAAQRLLKQRVRALAGTPATPPESLLNRLALLGSELGNAPQPHRRSPTRRLPALSVAGGLVVMAAAGGVAGGAVWNGRDGAAPGEAPAASPRATPASRSAPAPAYGSPREVSLWTVMTTGARWSGASGKGG
jgi:hypothetical protein